ncbi:MAG: FtsX-like permease family protein [Verrucomicrobiota bacterium]|nr:FtsX-like permease family protein [Verrucomicrobiota bacterium]
MTIFKLIISEIFHRKINFLLGLCSIILVISSFIVSITSLRAFDKKTEEVIADEQKKIEHEMFVLNDEIRKSMKGLGFNLYIFPAGQELDEVYAQGFASKMMPENYTKKLAKTKIMSINHLLPSLTQKIFWEEQGGRVVVLIGVKGEVPQMHRAVQKKAMINPVERNHVVVGYQLHQSLQIKPGDEIILKGHKFLVDKCNQERGTVDDITIWINLNQAQQILNKPDLINAILALECVCNIDALKTLRKKIATVLPGTKMIELKSKALVRSETRAQAKKTAEQTINKLQQKRETMKKKRENYALIIIPLIIIVSVAWIAYLTYINANERLHEIAILLATGVKTHTIIIIFLLKAFFMGLFAAITCLVILFVLQSSLSQYLLEEYKLSQVIEISEIIWILIATPCIACFSAWIPALIASRHDPAIILRH